VLAYLDQAHRGHELSPLKGRYGGFYLDGEALHKMSQGERILYKGSRVAVPNIVVSKTPTAGSCATRGFFVHDEVGAGNSLDTQKSTWPTLPMNSAGIGPFISSQLPGTAVVAVPSDKPKAPARGGRQQ